MIVRILREAEAELVDAIARYELMEAGLGVRLKSEIRKMAAWIGEHPELPRIRAHGYRRANLKVFPYYLPYVVWNGTVWILAMAHGAQRPEYWIDRSPSTR